ncbi:MAG TPA: enoyl-CoA hydratase-related protein [Acidothermaceae bacterium]|jgi:enoyl-CoA hydratase/carnithine racemase
MSDVITGRHGSGAYEVTINRPEARNAISTRLALTLTDTFRAVARDPQVRAVVISSSSDKAFCAGADLKERAGFTDEDLLAQRPVIKSLFASVRDLPVPAIAAVQGFALGGGFELALSCDLIVADETAVFGLTEVTVGLVPGGGGTQLLARRVGAGRAADLILTGRRVDAGEAFRLGIVDRMAPTGDARGMALHVAETIAGNSPLAVRAAKQAVRAAFDARRGFDVEDSAWHAAAVSADRREGIAAFAEKRAPNWTGR